MSYQRTEAKLTAADTWTDWVAFSNNDLIKANSNDGLDSIVATVSVGGTYTGELVVQCRRTNSDATTTVFPLIPLANGYQGRESEIYLPGDEVRVGFDTGEIVTGTAEIHLHVGGA